MATLSKRLVPLHAAVFLQGFWLWVPVEKLFMSEIGFTPASVGVMAAAYAALVPIAEIPCGILADRWSRRGVLIIAGIMQVVSSILMGLSTTVPAYILSSMLLGLYFAASSGTMESVVYDTVLEETGSGDLFTERIGRIRVLESLALVTSALAGGWLAGVTSTQLTYFVTVPFGIISILALLSFREPLLHKTSEPVPLRRQVSTTFHTVVSSGMLRPVIALTMLTSILLTTLYEFGPLWLVALSAAAVVYGPAWAGLMSTIGIGGFLAARIPLDRPATVASVIILSVGPTLLLIFSHSILVVTVAQIAVALVIMIISVHVSALLHDAVPSTIRSGVASGVSAFSWIAFIPFSLALGLVSRNHGIHSGGWLLLAVTVLASYLLAIVSAQARRSRSGTSDPCPQPAAV